MSRKKSSVRRTSPSGGRGDRSIEAYREKRNFARTPEPAPAAAASTPSATGHEFVVHRHEARRLHYDLRLEMDGVLCSFAVPRGFSYDPREKRLAVRTEDHPLAYLEFHGVIPRGEYGAGTMTIWDRGRYTLLQGESGREGLLQGKLEIVLAGRKLRGEWHLVATQREKQEWLLFKKNDHSAREGDDPAFEVDFSAVSRVRAGTRWTPLEVVELPAPPLVDPGWLYEMEFEGRRALVTKEGDRVRMRGGMEADLGTLEGALLRDLQRLRAGRLVMDGVLVALDTQERPSLEVLAEVLRGKATAPTCYYAFDLLALEDWDLRELPLRERKKALRSAIPETGHVLFVDHVEEQGGELLRVVESAALPGIIAKRADSPYHGGDAPWRRWRAGAPKAPPEVGVREALERAGTSPPSAQRRIRFTHRDKVYWPGLRITKGELLDYYQAAAGLLIPYLRQRPLHLFRWPDGIEGESFYQKNTPSHFPAWIPTEVIPTEAHQKPIRYTLCNETSALLYLINTGSIDLHPWHSRLGTLDQPDWAVIDLDPKGAPFAHVVRLARSIGRLLRGIGLASHLKTSGSTGLHIYLPLQAGYTYEQARMFCEGVARFTVREHPDIATVERNVDQRRGRVYVDFLQNRKGQTIVPPYVVRPVPAASVSTPLLWDELETGLQPADFTMRHALERFERLGDLFRPVLTDGQDLLPAIAALAQLVR